jgi:hypothetical protein
MGGHDSVNPRWLEVLMAELDAYPRLVGAFATGLGIGPVKGMTRDLKTPGDTFGMRRGRDRVRVRLPGVVMQGLFHPEYIERAGVLRRVLMPDDSGMSTAPISTPRTSSLRRCVRW